MKYFITSKISENIHETPEGYLVCVGVPIARTGEMVYGRGETPLEPGKDGTVIVDRAEDEVFRPETIASFEGKAITITHPTDFVDPENWSRLTKGVLQNVRRGEGDQSSDLIADLLITDSVAINLVKNGLREVSCGYEAEYTQTGEGRGVQTNIVGNHLALVDEGRAGSAYAINDHKGKGLKMKKLGEAIKGIFAKAQDEAMKVADEMAKDEFPPKKDDAKPDDKAKDAGGAEAGVKIYDAQAYDEMKKMVDALMGKIDSMMKPKDASTPPTENQAAKIDAKDEPAPTGMEDRIKALEASVAKLLENQAQTGDDDADGDGDGEESEDELNKEGEKAKDADKDESEDDDFDETTMTGDTASRVEILAPGLKLTKDAKAQALKQAYQTVDGKKIIDSLSGGKPAFEDAAKVETLFVAASEIMKRDRSSSLARTKTRDFNTVLDTYSEGSTMMTAEKMNELNAKHYAR